MLPSPATSRSAIEASTRAAADGGRAAESTPTCAAVRAGSFALADDELSSEETATLRAHAGRCPACRDALAGDAAFVRWMRDGVRRDERAPATLRARVERALTVARDGHR